MTPETPHQPRNWLRFLHRLWAVAGTAWLVAVTLASFQDTWIREIPSSDVYYRHDRCMELQERLARLPPVSDLPRPTDVFDAAAAGELDTPGSTSDSIADEVYGTPTPNAFDRRRARKAREEEEALNAAYAAFPEPTPTTSIWDQLRAEEARKNLELQAGAREAECAGAALAIARSRARFRQAAGAAAAVGLGIPLAILAIGHGIAWAARGLDS